MATWIAHLRIADNLLAYGFDLQSASFYVGNLAPDVPLPDDPQKIKSHFRDDYNQLIQPEDFYDTYLKAEIDNPSEYAFLIGYYVHLLVDVEWIGNVWRPFKHDNPDLAKRIETEPQFAYSFKRLEFFGHEFLYLDDNPNYAAWQSIQQIETVSSPLEFMPESLILKWLEKHVKPNYDDSEMLENAKNHEFPYLNRTDLQGWIDCTTGVMIEMLKGKGVPCPKPRPLWAGYIQPYA